MVGELYLKKAITCFQANLTLERPLVISTLASGPEPPSPTEAGMEPARVTWLQRGNRSETRSRPPLTDEAIPRLCERHLLRESRVTTR